MTVETAASGRGSKISSVASVAVLAAVTIVPATLGKPGPGVLVGLLLAIAIAWWRGGGFKPGLRWLGFRRPADWGRTWGWAIVFGVGLQLLSVVLLDPLFERLTGQTLDLSNFDGLRGNLGTLAIWLAIVWGVVVWLEEIVFRGFLLRELSRASSGRIGSPALVALSGVVFGLVHWYQGPAGVLSTGVIGAALALCYLGSGRNLWLPVLVHGIIDTVGLGLIYLDLDRWFSALWG